MKHKAEQHKKLYMLFNKTGLMPQRHSLVFSFSNERTENSSELSEIEIGELIKHLEAVAKDKPDSLDFEKGDRMRKRIISLCYEYGWTKWDESKGKDEVDKEHLNSWMLKYSYLRKPMNKYAYKELGKLVAQFETVVMKYLNKI